MEMTIFVFLGIVFGVIIGTMAMMSQKKLLQKEVTTLSAQVESVKQEAKEQLEKLTADKDKVCQEKVEAKEEACNALIEAQEKRHQDSLAAQEERHKEAMTAQQSRFDETIEKVTAQMKTATETMLKERQKEFAESSNTNLGQIVTPLKDTIDKMKKAIDESTLEQTKLGGEMKSHVENMIRQSEAAKKSAEELTRAFKHGSKVQGDWGETVLDELLESQGLTKGVHYELQPYLRDANGEVIKSDEGAKMRPDVILHLDQSRDVIIDSKVSMTAFMDYVNAENEDDKERFLKAHVNSINEHVKELSKKDYSSYIMAPKVKMDYVIMFVPHTGALWTALNAQPDLWRKAMEKNVYIADEQSLFAALRIVNLTWRQIVQAQNHEKVFELANEMLDRVGLFMKKYQAIGRALETATNAYNEGEKKLQPSGQSIVQTCNKLTKLGAKQSLKNPIPQLEEVEDDANTLSVA